MAREYTGFVQEAFPSTPTEPLGPVILANSAEAYIQLAQTLSDLKYWPSVDIPLLEVLSYLTLAAKFLTEAAKEDKTNARLFCLRGDVEMWRSRNILSNKGYQNGMTAVETLWANAGVYYRGAKRFAEVHPSVSRILDLKGLSRRPLLVFNKSLVVGVQVSVRLLLERRGTWKSFLDKCTHPM